MITNDYHHHHNNIISLTPILRLFHLLFCYYFGLTEEPGGPISQASCNTFFKNVTFTL